MLYDFLLTLTHLMRMRADLRLTAQIAAAPRGSRLLGKYMFACRRNLGSLIRSQLQPGARHRTDSALPWYVCTAKALPTRTFVDPKHHAKRHKKGGEHRFLRFLSLILYFFHSRLRTPLQRTQIGEHPKIHSKW